MEEIRAMFGVEHPTGARRPSAIMLATRRAAEAAAAGAACEPDARDSTLGQSFGDVLEACGGLVRRRGALAAHCEEAGAYELISRELVEELAAHISSRRAALLARAPVPRSADALEEELIAAEESAEADAKARAAAGGDGTHAEALMSDDPAAALRVLEVGAGNGELTHYLREALRRRTADGAAGGYSLVACDAAGGAAGGGAATAAAFGHVEAADYRAALARYRPHLVLCSWMPMGMDWSARFRATPSVGEYVLLGEVYDGACGHNWHTWGNAAFREPPHSVHDARDGPAAPPAPHEVDGWCLEELPDVSRWMLSRFASDAADCVCLSAAVAFRRG